MISLIYGPNVFGRSRALQAVIADFTQQFNDAEIERLDGSATDYDAVVSASSNLSLFSSNKLIVLRDASENKQLWESLSGFNNDETTTHIVIVESSVDKRTKTFKHLSKVGKVHIYEQPSERELLLWISDYAKEQDFTIDSRLSTVLLRRVGADQQRLCAELDKLAMVDHVLSEDDINELVPQTPENTVFDLLDAVIQGRGEVVNKTIEQLRLQEDPYKLFGLFVSQVYGLVALYHAKDRSVDAVAKDTGMHPFVLRKLTPISKRLSVCDFELIRHETTILDDRLKSSGEDPWRLLSITLNKIARH